MSAFKDQLKADIDNTFLNTNEFADLHIINEIEMAATIDEELEEYENLKDYDYDGLYKVKMIVFVNYNSFGKIPAIKSSIMVDGKKYFVLGASESFGMLNLILGVNKA